MIFCKDALAIMKDATYRVSNKCVHSRLSRQAATDGTMSY